MSKLLTSTAPKDILFGARCFCAPVDWNLALKAYLLTQANIAASPPCVTPTAPVAHFESVTNSTLALKWVQPANTGSLITSYIVQLGTTAGGPYTFSQTRGAGTHGAIFTGLTSGTTYFGIVTAVSFTGCTSTSAEISTTTGGGAPACNDGGVTAAWAAQVVANGGAAPSQATQNAFCTAVAGLKSDGVWASIVAANFGAPDSLIAFRTPILAGNGNALWTNTAFVAGDLSVNGLKGDGATKNLDSGINCGTIFASSQSCGFAWYAQNATGVGVDAGIDTVGSIFTFAAHFSDGNSIGQNGGAANDLRTPNHGAGYYCDSRVSNVDHRLYFANSTNVHAQIGATDAVAWNGALGNVGLMRLFCTDSTGATLFTSDTLSVFIWHQGLTSAQSAALFNRIDALRLAIGGRV